MSENDPAPRPAAEDPTTAEGGHSAAEPIPTRRRRWWLWGLLAVLVVLVGGAAWLGSAVLTAKDELQAAQAQVRQIGSGGDAQAAVVAITDHSERAVQAAQNPLWRLLEPVPVLGTNLHAVRIAAQAIHALGADLGEPVMAAIGQSGGSALQRVLVPLQSAAAPVAQAASEVSQVKAAGGLIEPVISAIDQLDTALTAANKAVQILPDMLGANGARKYLIVGQNNAESLALGGSAASTTLVRLDHGTVKIVKQATSQSYQVDVPLDVPLDPSAVATFGQVMTKRVNATVMRPDFPTAAGLLTAFWQRDIRNDKIDGVISIDPIALAHILNATGPITLPNGDELTSANLVRLTTNQVYFRYPDPTASDTYLKVVAKAVFDKIAQGSFDPAALVSALHQGIDGGSIMFYSQHPEIEQTIAGTQLSGILPADSAQQTTIGVYYQDFSLGSKIDYYMVPKATITRSCQAGKTTYTAELQLRLNLSQKAANKLPAYIKSELPDRTQFRTRIYVYGPDGSAVTAESTSPGSRLGGKGTSEDLGRPVGIVDLYTKPDQVASATITFTAAPGAPTGPLEVRRTPMINPVQVSTGGQACS